MYMNSFQMRMPLILGLAALIFGLHIWGALDPSIANWGFNHWAVAPDWLMYCAVGAILLVVISFVIYRRELRAHFELPIAESKPSLLTITGVSVVILAALYLFRSHALVYGDGFTVAAHIGESGTPEIFGQLKLQIGAVYLKWLWLAVFSGLISTDLAELFGIMNVFGGLIGVWALYAIASTLSRTLGEKIVILLALASSGSVLLFFGHVEHYTWPYAFGLWSLYFALRADKERHDFSKALIAATIASSLHMIALPFLVMALAVFYLNSSWGGRALRNNWQIGAALALASLGFVTLANALGFVDVFTAFVASRENAYSVLSWAHLLDQLNLFLFIAPLSPLVFLALFQRTLNLERASEIKQHHERTLFVCAILTTLPAFWIDPILGAVRDWDLLSFAGIPLSALIVLRIIRSCSKVSSRIALAQLMIAITLLHNLPNLYEKTDIVLASSHLDKMLWQDAHYQPDYRNAQRGLSWGYILKKEVGRPDLAEKYFVRHTQSSEFAPSSWHELGEIAFDNKLYDSAEYCYQQALRQDNSLASSEMRLAQAQDMLGKTDSALAHIQRAAEIDPDKAMVQSTAGVILLRAGRYLESLAHLRRGLALDTSSFHDRHHLGLVFAELQLWDSSLYYLQWCVASQPERNELYKPLLLALIRLERFDDAKRQIIWMMNEGFTKDELNSYAVDIKRSEELMRQAK